MRASYLSGVVLFLLVAGCSSESRNFNSTGSGTGGASTSSTTGHGGSGASTSSAGPSTGGSGGNGGHGGSGISVDAGCADYAMSICGRQEACAPDVLTYVYGSPGACQQSFITLCKIIVGAPQDGWTPQDFVDCGKADAQATCADFLLAPFTGGPEACQPKKGKIANDKACIDAGECVSSYCKHDSAGGCGHCKDRVASGKPCDSTFDCKQGLACVNSACVLATPEGHPCVANSGECAFGTACQGSPLTCKKARDNGDPCDSTSVCDPLQGLYCNTDSNVCMRASYAMPTEQCGPGLPAADAGVPGIVGCTASGICTADTPADGQAHCVAALAIGDACSTSSGPVCSPPALCITGHCALANLDNCD